MQASKQHVQAHFLARSSRSVHRGVIIMYQVLVNDSAATPRTLLPPLLPLPPLLLLLLVVVVLVLPLPLLLLLQQLLLLLVSPPSLNAAQRNAGGRYFYHKHISLIEQCPLYTGFVYTGQYINILSNNTG